MEYGSIQKLRSLYASGKNALSFEYQRQKGAHLAWQRMQVSLITQPGSQDLMAFIYISDVDEWKRNQLAMQSVIEEDVEFISRLNLESGKLRMVRDTGYLETFGIQMGSVINYDSAFQESLQRIPVENR